MSQTSELLGESVLPTLLGQELIINPDLSAAVDPLFANSSVPANITATESTATIIDADECNCDACTVCFSLRFSHHISTHGESCLTGCTTLNLSNNITCCTQLIAPDSLDIEIHSKHSNKLRSVTPAVA